MSDEVLRVLGEADGKLLSVTDAVSEVVGEAVPMKRAARWVADGLQGPKGATVKLEAVLVGKGFRTTTNAVRRFLSAVQRGRGATRL